MHHELRKFPGLGKLPRHTGWQPVLPEHVHDPRVPEDPRGPSTKRDLQRQWHIDSAFRFT